MSGLMPNQPTTWRPDADELATEMTSTGLFDAPRKRATLPLVIDRAVIEPALPTTLPARHRTAGQIAEYIHREIHHGRSPIAVATGLGLDETRAYRIWLSWADEQRGIRRPHGGTRHTHTRMTAQAFQVVQAAFVDAGAVPASGARIVGVDLVNRGGGVMPGRGGRP